jgi:hypothetical protein
MLAKNLLNELGTTGQKTEFISNTFAPAFNRFCTMFDKMKRSSMHRIMRGLVCKVKQERSLIKIMQNLCDRLTSRYQPISTIEQANAAYIISQMDFTEQLFEKLWNKH